MNFCDLSIFYFIWPFRVSKQLTAHGGTGDTAVCKLFFYKIRLVQTANTGDWLICIVPDFIAKFQEASLFFKIWMICRRNGIFQTGMICKSDMKTGYTGVFQQRNKDSKLRFKHTGISIVRIFLTDSQFIIDRKIRQTFAYGLNGFCGKTCTALPPYSSVR